LLQLDFPLKIFALPTQKTLKVFHLAKRESYRLKAAKYVMHNVSLTSVNRIIKCDLCLKCMLVCCRRSLPGSHWIVPVLTTSFIRVFSQIMLHFFRKHLIQACSTIIPAILPLFIDCPYSVVNPVVAEQIYMMPELCC